MDDNLSDKINQILQMSKSNEKLDIQSILSSLGDFKNNSEEKDTGSEKNSFNLDPNTIMAAKKMFDSMNDSKNDYKRNLLLSLKPFLKKEKQEKLNKYMSFLNMSKITKLFNESSGGS